MVPKYSQRLMVALVVAGLAGPGAGAFAQELDPLYEPPPAEDDPFAETPSRAQEELFTFDEPVPEEAREPEVLDLETSDFARPQDDQSTDENIEFQTTRTPESATLRALDKITAKTLDIVVGIDETVAFERLAITLRTCNRTPPEEPPEVTAFLEVSENTLSGEELDLFTGWMFASSPGLSALEHPVYDVWVIDCKMSEPETTAGIE